MIKTGSYDNPISLVDDGDIGNDNVSNKRSAKVYQERSRKRRQKQSPKSAPFSPIRIFASTSDDNETRMHCNTLRQIMGLDDDQNSDLSQSSPIKWIVIINFLIDFDYLLDYLPELISCERVLIFYGEISGGNPDVWRKAFTSQKNGEEHCSVEFIQLKPSDPPRSKSNPLPFQMRFGVHHTKMFLIGYESNIRVVIHTANLIYQDVNLKTQGAYVQDFSLKDILLESKDNVEIDPLDLLLVSSPFEEALVEYLESYKFTKEMSFPLSYHSEELVNWIDVIRQYDYASAYAILIPSTPGWHKVDKNCNVGYLNLSKVIQKYVPQTINNNNNDSHLIFQFSSLGSLTPKWLFQDFQSSLLPSVSEAATTSKRNGSSIVVTTQTTKEEVVVNLPKIIWPTSEEIRTSIEGYVGGSSVPGTLKNVSKPFLTPLYHKWAGDTSIDKNTIGKHNNIPHIKSYLQVSKSNSVDMVDWFVLSSHNLSKAAWGEIQQSSQHYGESRLMIRHWELGVFFSSKVIIDSNYLNKTTSVKKSTESTDIQLPTFTPYNNDNRPEDQDEMTNVVLPIPFSIHPLKYKSNDQPWAIDRPCSLPDKYGRTNS